MQEHLVLGVDIGGTGIKGGIIDINTGEMIGERHRILTPQPATTTAVTATFCELVEHFKWTGTIGVGFPAIIRNGTSFSATNIDNSWIGTNIEDLLSIATGCPVHVLNDADAAGLASVKYGAAKGYNGIVLMLTIGTGIGSALIVNGHLVPNSELGHIYLRNKKTIAEKQLSKSFRKANDLSWVEWGKYFNEYLQHIQLILAPDLVIVGGGGSKHLDKYINELDVNFEIKAAHFLNKAGSIGAAYYAFQKEQ